MRTLIDNDTGAIVLIPQSDGDKNLIFHLLDCSDLTRFSEYLALEQKHPISSDLGCVVEEFAGYPAMDRSPLQWVNHHYNG